MKKVKTIFICMVTVTILLFSQRTNAQINLEHTFEGYVHFSNTIGSYPLFSSHFGDAELYILDFYGQDEFPVQVNQIKLYNTDYSLYKSINLPSGYYLYYSNFLTKELFNNDSKIEIMAYISNEEQVKIIIINEDGMILKEFGNNYDMMYCALYKVNDQFKLSMYNYDNHTTEIYSLPGTMLNVVPQMGGNIFQPPYPNPANSTITLPYQLKQGEISTMRIYSMNGQLIETKQIDSAFDKILLNVSNYRRGMYLYEVNGESKRFIVR